MSTDSSIQVGDLVRGSYKTGVYIGEVAELTHTMKAAVKILAVVKHPTQGDLHQHMDANAAFFHRRRALSFQEIALMPLSTLTKFVGHVPNYRESLYQALDAQIEELTNMEQWARRSLQELQELKREYV